MSLGLVAYDNSEDSESDSGTEDKPLVKTVNNALPSPKTQDNPPKGSVCLPAPVNVDKQPLVTSENGSAHFSDEEIEPEKSVNLLLPESKMSLINTDIDIRCLTSATKKGGPVKITIPSLNEVIDEDEQPSKKKIKPSRKGSGLFALLPSPKSTLVPQSVTAKKPTPTVKKSLPRASTSAKSASKPVSKTSALISYDDSGDEEETSGTVDFFSLESKDDLPSTADVNIDIPEISSTFNNPSAESGSSHGSSEWQSPQVASVGDQATSSYPTVSTNQQPDFGYSTSEFMNVDNTDLELDQQAMQQLCGRRDRLKMQEVNLIDVSGDAIMPDSREWLTKQLTEEVAHRPSHKRKDGPTSQQKRKHQITYLAYQAKENELELKNQWANNRMSRKQTQAKYGF